MAKSNTIQVKMVSTADTGYFYVKFKNPKSMTEKLEMKKYDPKARKHVIFKEQKIDKIDYKSHKDLTHIPFVTIDGENSKDFDDAVFAEVNKEKN